MKLLEKMRTLVWFGSSTTADGNFSAIQYGLTFTLHHRYIILQLETIICWGFTRKLHLLSVFFGLEKVYDTAWRHGIFLLYTLLGCWGAFHCLKVFF